MSKLKHINPDHYLESHNGREWTPELSKQAWELAYAKLEDILCFAPLDSCLYLVCGLQGAGKSTWVKQISPKLGVNDIFFDAALPARQHRKRVIDMASAHQIPVVAVWINTPLEIALQRNAGRTIDQQVPEFAIRHVCSILEPPSEAEGFVKIMEINELNH